MTRKQTDPEEVARLAGLGLTQAAICQALGISRTTLHRRKRESRAFAEALERGRARGAAAIAEALLHRALEGNVQAQIFYLRHQPCWNDAGPAPEDAYEPDESREALLERLRRLVARAAAGAGAANPPGADGL